MANTIYTVKSLTTVAAKVGAEMFKNKLKFCKTVDREDESTFGQTFKSVQPGDTINITKPARRTPRTNATYSAVDITEEKVALAVDQRSGDDFELTSLEIATDAQLKSWVKRFVEPSIDAIASNVEQRVLQTVMQGAYQMTGTPGTTVNAALPYLQASQKLFEQCVPDDRIYGLITPGANAASVDALKALPNPSGAVGNQYDSGMMKSALGIEYQMSNLLWSFTTGTQAGYASALSNGATQSGSTIAIDGMTGSATIKQGTIVTFAGVYDVNPVTKATLGNTLKQFVVTADVTLSGGAGNLSISPSLVASGTTQNASTTIANDSVVTFVSGTAASTTYSQNLLYHPSAVRFCSLPLPIPKGVHDAYTETADGISIRAVQWYDGATDKMKMRLDTQFGVAVVRPEWLVRITN